MEKIRLVLAVDLERSGGRAIDQTIALGASIVNKDLGQLDSLFIPAYVPGETTFEPRCKLEFWDKNMDILNQLVYTGPLSGDQIEQDMIYKFHQFRLKWELNTYYSVEFCSDNGAFDIHYINLMYAKHLPDILPLPYSATTPQKYMPLWETHSMQRGLLAAVDSNFKSNWGYTDRIKELYIVPESPHNFKHDHLPHHDAYTIACELQIMLGIRDKTIKLRSEK